MEDRVWSLESLSETLENDRWEPPIESTYMVRIVCRHGNAGVLRLRESKPMVHFGVRGRVPVGFGIRISTRRLALWSG